MLEAEKLKTYDPKKFRAGYMSVKRNGIHATFDPKLGIFYSRTPREIKGLEHLIEPLKSIPYPVVGELTIPGLDFEEASGKIRSFDSTPDAVFSIFNTIRPGIPFSIRHNDLKILSYEGLYKNPKIKIEPMIAVDNILDFDRFYKKHVEAGEEGVCWISADHVYKPGKRTWDWMKRIPMKSIEVTVIDILPGTKGKKYENSLGKLRCGFTADSGEEKEVNVGIFKDKTDEWRQAIYNSRATDTSLIGKNITIEFKALSKYGIPTQPRYIGERWDL